MSVCAAPTCSHQSFDGSSYYVDVDVEIVAELVLWPKRLWTKHPVPFLRIRIPSPLIKDLKLDFTLTTLQPSKLIFSFSSNAFPSAILSGKQTAKTAPRGSLVSFSLLKTNEKTGYGFEPVLCNKWIVWQTVSKLKPVWMHQIRPKLCQLLIQTIGFHGNIPPNIEMEEITESFLGPRVLTFTSN